MNEDNRKAAIRMAAFLSGLVSERNPLSALRLEAGGVNILDGSQYIMGSGKPDARIILDPVVDLFQMIRRAAADLKHKIEFACEIVAGDDVGIQIDLADEFVVIARMLHADLHQDRDVVPQLGIVCYDGIGLDQARLLHLLDALNDGGYGQMDGFTDIGCGLSRVLFQLGQNLKIKIVHNGFTCLCFLALIQDP